jgi:hypothetical protein
MASPMSATTPQLPPEAIEFASRMFDAARRGQVDIFEQALSAGLPANMTNEKGDSLVHYHFYSFKPYSPFSTNQAVI